MRHPASRKRFRRILIAWSSAALSTGCYSYTPLASGATPEPGRRMRVDLTRQGGDILAPRIGADATRLEGSVEARTDTAYVLRLDHVLRRTGLDEKWTGELLVVPFSAVDQASLTRVSPTRSALFAAAIAGGLFLLRAAMSREEAVATDHPAPPAGQQ